MATWKKIITSGSAADLSSLTLDTGLANSELANSSINFGGVSLALGASDTTPAFNLSDATAYVGDSALVTVGALDSGGSITSGFGNIDIGTSTLNTGNATVDTLKNDSTVAGSHLTGSFTGSFIGDGSNLDGVGFQIDELSNTLTAVAQADLLVVADADDSNEEKKITFTNFEDQIFSNINAESSDVSVAAGGAISLANNSVGNDEMADNAIGNAELKQNDDITLQSLTLTGDLTVNGTTTTIATTNTKVEDKFMFLATGSAGTNTDAGIMVQSGSVDLSGSAFYHDVNVVAGTNPNGGRWSVAKSVGHDVTAIDPLQFVSTVKTEAVNPDTTSGSYGAGEMHVNTSTGEIWIRFG